MNTSRRHFFRTASALAAVLPGARAPLALSLAGLGALAADRAHAADTSGYKALVCLFMLGGNDSHNWVVPLDASGYAEYAKVRAELKWPTSRLQAISASLQATGRSFGMPQELSPLRNWYTAGQAALLANVGPLVRPITKAQYKAGGAGVPRKLFSHNDQQSTWQSLATEGAPSGWGGRMGDLFASVNAQPVFTAVSAAGNVAFLSGRSVTQYQVGEDGPLPIKALASNWLFGTGEYKATLQKAMSSSSNNAFQAEYARIVRRTTDTTDMLRTALASTSIPALSSTLAEDSLAKQLRIVAQMIAAGSSMGMKRQVFMVTIGGFDSHSNQMNNQPVLMNRVAQSTDWFLRAVQGAGLLNNTTLFSASDFGRTLTSNGDGSDHGWGGHHFVAGGAVQGGNIYGQFPITALGTDTDVGSGRLLPTTSVTQYAATLGRWMGLTPAELLTVLPNLGEFSQTDLGFLKV
ncbi:MAG: hypothetical protein RLZZ352_2328 [Pseudomonadota bacterium]|jgi:uncharacterized protein (DUF1501 family)